jgi:hypothetical protein
LFNFSSFYELVEYEHVYKCAVECAVELELELEAFQNFSLPVKGLSKIQPVKSLSLGLGKTGYRLSVIEEKGNSFKLIYNSDAVFCQFQVYSVIILNTFSA